MLSAGLAGKAGPPRGGRSMKATISGAIRTFFLAVVAAALAAPGAHAGTLTFLPSSVSFGLRNVAAGPSTASNIRVTNTVSFTHIQTISIGGTNAGDFSFQDVDCGNLLMSANTFCFIDVYFDPSAVGAKSASLTLVTDSGTFTMNMSGTGIAAPSVITTAATLVATTSATLNGSGNPNAAATTGWFRYSTTDPGTCNDVFG